MLRQATSSILGMFIVLAVGVGACVGSPTLQTFTSSTYAYTIGYPVGWSVGGALRPLGDAENPILVETASDRFTRNQATDSYPLVFIAAQPVPAGISLERWGAFTLKVGSPHIGCQPARQEAIHAGGEPATIYIYECGGGFVLWTALVHGNQGYDVVLLSLPGDEEATDRAVYDRMLATLAFTN